MKNKRFHKKSQVWVSDYTIALLLFTLAALLSVKIIVNNFSTNTAFEELKSDASEISGIFLSEGYPSNWVNESVIRPGLLTSNRLNSSKIVNAMNMSYSSLKPKLQTRYDFLVLFEDPDNDMIEFNDFCAIGSPDVSINATGAAPFIDCHNPDFTSINYDNLVKITRLAIYDFGSQSEIIRMVVYVWN